MRLLQRLKLSLSISCVLCYHLNNSYRYKNSARLHTDCIAENLQLG